ncbi:MAG: hypothetical protein L0Z62_47325, partial [Gemmataceae bacterium]|nr:hypothetical protein [Gemmataceae bacterium]
MLPHARAAFAVMGGAGRMDDAKRILCWLEQADPKALCGSVKSVNEGAPFLVSRRNIHAHVFGGSRRSEELDPALTLLIDYGYLRPATPEQRSGPGRKPSELLCRKGRRGGRARLLPSRVSVGKAWLGRSL